MKSEKPTSLKKSLSWLPLCSVVVVMAVVAWSLLHFESELLWKAQELNLFLDTPLFLEQQQVTSGWLLTWLGCWLTEFFYHPALGVAWLIGWWSLLMFLVAKAFRIPRHWAVLLLVPVVLLLLTDVSLGYWIYYLKLRGHFFAATIGTTMAVAAVWLYTFMPAKYWVRPLFVFFSTVLLYPLIGFYGLLASLLMGIVAWRQDKQHPASITQRLVISAAALLAIAAVPQFYYRYVFCQTNIVNIYWTGLPIFCLEEETPEYYTPYYILVAWLVLLAAVSRFRRWSAGWLALACQAGLLFLMAWGTYSHWYKDYNFHKELRMQRCMEQCDWQGVLAEAADQHDEPTRAIVMMRNLALFRLGRQADEMYHYLTGAKASDTPLPLRMTQVVGRSIYYNYGQLNFCYRWCLEDGVEMGWRVEYMKYLVRCSLVSGDYRVARKYIDLLKHTRYYRDWAVLMERFIGNEQAMRQDPEFEQIFHLLTYDDQLASDNSMVEYFLMNHFILHHSEDPLYQLQEVLSALWLKDIQAFWPRFFMYAQAHPHDHMPVHFQEAAYLYGHLEHEVDISQMPFDEQVKKDYADFMAMAKAYPGMSEEKLGEIMRPRFGHTFYYEYFLIRNQKLY